METLLPSPDSAFQLGDFLPMVKVGQKVFVILEMAAAINESSPGGWIPLCDDQTKSVGVCAENKWRGGGAGREKSFPEGLAH